MKATNPMICIILILVLVLCAFPVNAQNKSPFNGFLGINQSGDWAGLQNMGINWERSHIEPNAGWPEGPEHEYDFSQYDKKILEAKSKGITILPLLAYSVRWAAPVKDYNFDYKGIHYTVKVDKDDKPSSGYTYTRIGIDPATGKEVSRKPVTPEQLSPRRDYWEAYVTRLVSRYSKPPFNIKYWHIWNEGTMESGPFWGENLENYVDNVHIPAAKIIRKYGGKVVWGGWPDCNTLTEYDQTLNYHDAWKYTDILDVHYQPPVAFDYLYKRWVANGKIDGIWMTEIGFTQTLDQVANTYPRMFYWALNHGLKNNDKYKTFWFAWWSPDDPKAYGYKCCLLRGETLTSHGEQIKQLSQLLSGKTIKLYKNFRVEPTLNFSLNEREGSVESFQVDGRYVFAMHIPVTASGHWIDWRTGDSKHMGMNKIQLVLKGLAGDKYRAEIIPLPGKKTYDAVVSSSGSDLIIDLVPPISPGETTVEPMSNERIFYVVVKKI
ncbi:MAG: hypothetical protein ACYC27_02420 [Armatimonadota bacterium]